MAQKTSTNPIKLEVHMYPKCVIEHAQKQTPNTPKNTQQSTTTSAPTNEHENMHNKLTKQHKKYIKKHGTKSVHHTQKFTDLTHLPEATQHQQHPRKKQNIPHTTRPAKLTNRSTAPTKKAFKTKTFQQPIKIHSIFVFKKMDTFHWTSRPGPAGDGPTVWCGYANLTNHVWESDVEDQS